MFFWSFYDMKMHKTTVSLMAEFKTQNLIEIQRPFCNSEHSLLVLFLKVTCTILFQIKATTDVPRR